MENSKDHKAAAEPPLDCRVGQRIERYLRQLAPHQNEREGPTLLREALAEIDVLAYWGPRWQAEHKENERLRNLLRQVLTDAQAQNVLLEWWHALECETVPNF